MKDDMDELSYEEVPGYKRVFFLFLSVSIIYLAVIFISSL